MGTTKPEVTTSQALEDSEGAGEPETAVTAGEEQEAAGKTSTVLVAVVIVVVFVALLAAAGLLCRKKLPACCWQAAGMPLYRAATNPFSGWWQEKHKTIIKSGGDNLNMSELAPDDGALIHADATIPTYVAEGK